MLDKFFIGLTYMVIVNVIVVYILAFLKLYEALSLIIVYFLLYIFLLQRRDRSPDKVARALGMNIVIGLLDMADSRGGIKGAIYQDIKSRKDILVANLLGIVKRPYILAVLLPLSYIATLRIALVVRTCILGGAQMADPYVHLVWAKYLQRSRLFVDQLYPMGYHAILATIGTLSFMDLYHVIRFTGPVAGILFILTIFYVARSLGVPDMVAILVTVIFGLDMHRWLPADFDRQLRGLPMEFSSIFVLPGLLFLVRYIFTPRKENLYYFFGTVAATSFIHPYSTGYLALGTLPIVSMGCLLRKLTFKNLASLCLASLGGIVLGNLPVLLGFIGGIPTEGSLTWATSTVVLPGGAPAPKSIKILPFIAGFIKGPSWYLLGLGTAVFVIICNGLRMLILGKNSWQSAARLSWGFAAIIMLIFYRLSELSIIAIMDIYRLSLGITLVLCVLFAFAISELVMLSSLLIDHRFITVLVGITMAYTIVSLPPYYPPVTLIEYPAAAENYFRIKAQFPKFEWTLVAPVEQFEESLGYGYHVELWKFFRRYRIEHAEDPDFDPPIPTKYVFFFIEKVPLKIWERGLNPDDFPGPTEKYYRIPEMRANLEQEAYVWCKIFHKTHKNVTVFYEDSELIIYQYEHDPTPYIGKAPQI
ncbi:MAG: hypothetical protein HPY71_03310 [Firmicutes bacterium]|nr:hypothetical protein [Bacillota bacterium]